MNEALLLGLQRGVKKIRTATGYRKTKGNRVGKRRAEIVATGQGRGWGWRSGDLGAVNQTKEWSNLSVGGIKILGLEGKEGRRRRGGRCRERMSLVKEIAQYRPWGGGAWERGFYLREVVGEGQEGGKKLKR